MYQVQKKDIVAASMCLGAAFEEYPVFTYIISGKDKRIRNLEHIFRFLINLGLLNGEVTANSDSLDGISIWYSSHSLKSSFFDAVRSGIVNLKFRLDKESFSRFLGLNSKKQIMRNKILCNKDYYLLDVLGVNPACQGQGIASALLAAKLKEIDRLGVCSYLETSDSNNVHYYGKFGFSCISQYDIDELKVYCLLREPVL